MRTRDSAKSDSLEGWSRRRFLLAAGSTAGAAGLSGCSSVTNYEFSAKPVVLPEDARANMGYETLRQTPVVRERSKPIGGVEVNVTVTDHISVYGATKVGERGTVTAPLIGVASTPKASVRGRSFNPLTRLSLANLLTSEAGTSFLQQIGVDEIGHSRSKIRWERGPTFVASREGTCLGTQTLFESYVGILGGEPPTVVFVHIARVDADNVVLTSAAHGHDTEDPERVFVKPDLGYLSSNQIKEAVGTFTDATAALQFRKSK